MAYKDNRQFIDDCVKTGDAVKVKQEVDWDLEAGAIIRHTSEIKGPAPLFENIKDYSPDYRLSGALLSTYRRVAIAMGFKPDSSAREVHEEYSRRIEKLIKPIEVKHGPCKENIILGKKVDLFSFPAPLIHDGDGGRYMTTWHALITKDQDTDWTNWGIYRGMVYNHNTLGVLIHPMQHQGKIFYSKYAPINKPMPFACAIGCDPLSQLAAGSSPRKGENEVDFAGALRQESVELIKCETNDLLVPAHAEIILEGEVIPDIMIPEGPFGEFTGFRTPMGMRPAYRINAVTYRNNPILTFSNPGFPPCDDTMLSITESVATEKALKRRGISITNVYVPPEGALHLVIIGLKKMNIANAERIKNMIDPIFSLSKIILVDEDVDVFNLNEVFHSLATKCHPGKGIRKGDSFCMPLSPYPTAEDRKLNRQTRAIFDATWPADWSVDTDIPPRVSFNEVYPADVKTKVLKNWKAYGFKD